LGLLYFIALVDGMFTSKSIIFSSTLVLVVVWVGRAQNPVSIKDLVACLNEKLVNKGNVDMSRAVEDCMPQGCKITVSMSTASAQPACNIANTQLPRVYFNCPGASPGLRFRPTFTLCPNDAHRIEVGEDVSPIVPLAAVPMQMANILIPTSQPMVHELSDYLNTPNNNLRCTRCHGNASPGITGDAPLLSSPFDPFTVQRRNLLPFVIYSTEPTRKALIAPSATVAGMPVTVQTLDQICAGIRTTLESNPTAFGSSAPNQALCDALASYINNRSCGNGGPNVRCGGVRGGGIFGSNGISSTVALEFSGQAVFESQSPNPFERVRRIPGFSQNGRGEDVGRPLRLAFKANDVDGTLTAFNASTQTTINAVALSSLEEVNGEDGDGVQGSGNYAFTGSGKAWVNGITAAIAIRISFNQASNLSQIAITSPGGEFYAGGTAVGVRFTVTPPIP
jgi:hypothetical protein